MAYVRRAGRSYVGYREIGAEKWTRLHRVTIGNLRPGTDYEYRPSDDPGVDRSPNTHQAGKGVIYAKVSPGGKISDISNDFSRFAGPQRDIVAVRDDTAHRYAIVHVRGRDELAFTA